MEEILLTRHARLTAGLNLVSDTGFASSGSEVQSVQKLNLAGEPDGYRMIKSLFGDH